MNTPFTFEDTFSNETSEMDELSDETLFGRQQNQSQPDGDLEWEAPARPGFGNTPRSFALRVRIIGYASPRWRGAKTALQADQLNYALSSKRAEAVRVLVEKELRARLGNGIKIDYAVSEVEPTTPQGINLGSYGVGSRDAGGNRQDNSEINRRVEVIIEKITTTYVTSGVSLPPQRVSGLTDSWSIGVKKLRVVAIGGAIASIEVVLRNRFTNKEMYATANLYGGGIGAGSVKAGGSLKKQIANETKNKLSQAVSDFLGRGEVFFTTKNKMGFEGFDGQFIRIGKVGAALGIKAVYAYAVFPFISYHPKLLVFQHKVSAGLIDLEGWVASGKLHLRGHNPGNWVEYDRTGQVQNSYDQSWQETLILTFPTGKHAVLPSEQTRLKEFVGTWARRFL